MGITITIDSEFVDLVDTMRQAQNHFYKMASDKSGTVGQHQRIRALQAAKASEHKVDEWIRRHREAVKKLKEQVGNHRTGEVQGSYLAEIK